RARLLTGGAGGRPRRGHLERRAGARPHPLVEDAARLRLLPRQRQGRNLVEAERLRGAAPHRAEARLLGGRVTLNVFGEIEWERERDRPGWNWKHLDVDGALGPGAIGANL